MKTRWAAILAFAVIFIAGGACGWILSLRYAPAPSRPTVARPFTRPQDFGVQLMRRWVGYNQLGLSPGQKVAIRPIINDAAEQLRRLRLENQHSAEVIIEHMQDSIAAELTPEQRIRFDDMIQTQRQRLQRFFQQQQMQRAKQLQQQQQQGRVP